MAARLAARGEGPVARRSAPSRSKESDKGTAEASFLAAEHGPTSSTPPREGARSRSRDSHHGPLAPFATAVLALTALAPRAVAQNVAPESAELARHLAAIRVERTERFDRLWDAASDLRRAAAERALSLLSHSAGPANHAPSLSDLAAFARVLEGADPERLRTDALSRNADALDLMVVPGYFAASSGVEGERGEPVEVRVWPLARLVPVGDVLVHLEWIAPDGAVSRVRTQTVLPPAFAAPGFALYARAPLSSPGTWQARVAIEHAGRTAHSAPVPFECVAARGARAEPEESSGAARGEQRRRIEDELDVLARFGVRPETGRTPSSLRAELAGRLVRGAPEPLALGGADAWSAGPVDGARCVLLFLAPGGERPSTVLSGARGAAWLDVAERTSSRLVSARFDLERETPAALVERVRALHPELPVVAVLRGEADTRVRVALLAAGSRGRVPADVLPADRVVVASSLPVTPPVAGLPTLLVGPPNPSAGGEHVVQIEAPAQALLTDRGLPGLVEAWLAP